MKLEIFEKANRTRIDLIRTYNFVQYIDEFSGKGSFQITIPTTEETLMYLTFGNYILFEDGVVGIIKSISNSQDEDTEIIIKGTLTNGILRNRSFLKTAIYYDTISNIARQMITDLIISPEDITRKIDFITLSEDEQYNPVYETKIRKQNTGDELITVLSEMFLTEGLGFELYPVIKNFNPVTGQYANMDNLEFRILKPVDRTINNPDGNVPVVFSFDLNNLANLFYEEDGMEYCTVAIVASEGTGQERKTIEVGETEKTGIDRIELYVDARDLQSDSSSGESGSTPEINPENYYTKDETYNKTEVNELIDNISVEDGKDGEDGYSPTVEVSKVDKTTTLAITDIDGTKYAYINDGVDGQDGQDGQDGTNGKDGTNGYSPTISTSKVGKTTTVTITDVNGTKVATINDGQDGQDGQDGEDGQDGTNGKDGSAATIEVGTVTTGEAGTQAKVTNSGTSTAAKFNFVIPKGDKGDKGDKGEPGDVTDFPYIITIATAEPDTVAENEIVLVVELT